MLPLSTVLIPASVLRICVRKSGHDELCFQNCFWTFFVKPKDCACLYSELKSIKFYKTSSVCLLRTQQVCFQRWINKINLFLVPLHRWLFLKECLFVVGWSWVGGPLWSLIRDYLILFCNKVWWFV